MKKGFATSAILYTMLLLFLVLMVGILNNLQNKKVILDALKQDTIQALEQDTIMDAVFDQIGIMQNKIASLEEELTQLKKEDTIDGSYLIFFNMGKIQAEHYCASNTYPIPYVANKKITILSVKIEGVFYLTEAEIALLSRCIVYNRYGMTIYFISADTQVQSLAKKIEGYTLRVEFTISDQ